MEIFHPFALKRFELNPKTLEPPFSLPYDISHRKKERLIDLILYGLRKHNPSFIALAWKEVASSLRKRRRLTEFDGVKLPSEMLLCLSVESETELSKAIKGAVIIPSLTVKAMRDAELLEATFRTFENHLDKITLTQYKGVYYEVLKILRPPSVEGTAETVGKGLAEFARWNVETIEVEKPVVDLAQKTLSRDISAQLKNPDQLVSLADEILWEEDRDEVRSAALAVRALGHLKKGEVAQALEDISTAYEINPLEGLLKIAAAFYFKGGRIYQEERKLDNAVECYQQTLRRFEALKDERGLAATYNNMGQVYYAHGKWDEALKFYDKSLKTSELIGDFQDIATAYMNIGNVYQLKGEWDNALEFYQKSLEVEERIGDIHGLAVTWGNIGLIYKAKGEWDKALEFFNKSLKVKGQIGDIHGMAQTWGNMGILYKEMGDEENAVGFLHSSFSTFKKIGAQYEAETISQHLMKLKRKPKRQEKKDKKPSHVPV